MIQSADPPQKNKMWKTGFGKTGFGQTGRTAAKRGSVTEEGSKGVCPFLLSRRFLPLLSCPLHPLLPSMSFQTALQETETYLGGGFGP